MFGAAAAKDLAGDPFYPLLLDSSGRLRILFAVEHRAEPDQMNHFMGEDVYQKGINIRFELFSSRSVQDARIIELNAKELGTHARSLPPYMRPRHWIILEPGTLPLNRVAKPDHMRAKQMADEEIAKLRENGGWDRGYEKAGDLAHRLGGMEKEKKCGARK